MDRFPFTPSGLRLLEYITNQVEKYGRMNLANLIEDELQAKHRCFKVDCAYCTYFKRSYGVELPETIVIPTRDEKVFHSNRKWSVTEDRVILSLHNYELGYLMQLLPGRSYAAIRLRRAKLYKHHIKLIRRYGHATKDYTLY